jgi:hypothetical protein
VSLTAGVEFHLKFDIFLDVRTPYFHCFEEGVAKWLDAVVNMMVILDEAQTHHLPYS